MIEAYSATADDVIDAVILLDTLATPAADLKTGDRIVYRRRNVIHNTEVETVTPAENFGRDGVTVRTVNGDAWSCSPQNRGQYRLPR